MNVETQKLIIYNEKVLAHFNDRRKLSTSDLMDCFVVSSKLLQKVVKSGLELTTDLKKSKLQVASTLEVKKKLLESLFKKSELEETSLSSLYNLKVSYKNVDNECRQLRKEVAQLTAEIELLKENEQNRF
jgi:hypothetical protein